MPFSTDARLVTDALGRVVDVSAEPRRVVSLVPSETESVARLAGVSRIVGRTEFCEEPAGEIERVPTVGGTKKIDVDRVLDLCPDLVLANQEENGRTDVRRLIEAGVRVHVSFPRSVREALSYLRTLLTLLHLPAGAIEEHESRFASVPRRAGPPVRVFAPVWRDPWMTFDGRTYASDLLACAGADNVFSDRPRRYPLAADIAGAEPMDAGDRDSRYPRTTKEEVAARAPRLILLPDEPFRFGEAHAAEVAGWGTGARVRLVSGKDLFWYGVRSTEAMARLAHLVSEASGE